MSTTTSHKAKLARYVDSIPDKLPAGQVLVHNHVRPRKTLNAGGFRAWTQKVSDKPTLVLCNCKWAGADLHRLPHYRVDFHVSANKKKSTPRKSAAPRARSKKS